MWRALIALVLGCSAPRGTWVGFLDSGPFVRVTRTDSTRLDIPDSCVVSRTITAAMPKGHWRPAVTLDSAALAVVTGTFRAGDTSYLVAPGWGRENMGPGAVLQLLGNGRLVQLWAVADTSFLSARGDTLEFSGGASRFEWRGPNGRRTVAERERAYRIEPRVFHNGTVTLSGTALLPNTPGKHPGIVFVHGSGAAHRYVYWTYAHELVRRGIAALIYDKRGVGRSTGNLGTASLADLADDALAAVAALRAEPDVDSGEVGLMGFSQGGWILPIAAAQSRLPRFLITVSAAGVSPAEQEAYRMAANATVDGLSPERAAALRRAWLMVFAYARTHHGAAALDSAVLPLQDAVNVDDRPLTAHEVDTADWLRHLGYDYESDSSLQRVHVPILALWGGVDKVVPVDQALAVDRHAVAISGNPDVTYRIFPHGTHGLFLGQTGVTRECVQAFQFVPGLTDTVATWVHNRSRS